MNNPTYQNTKKINKFSSNGLMFNFSIIKNFFRDEIIHGGHLIGLAASAIALSTMILLNTIIHWEFLLIIYLGTLCIYNFDHYKEIDLDYNNNNLNRSNHLNRYKKLYPFILTFYGINFFALLIYFGSIQSIIFGGILLLSSLFYASKIKKLTSKIVGLKNFYTAFSFSLLIIFTGIYCLYPINLLLLLIFAFIFLRLFIDTSFCDIKDMETDKKQNLLTLPLYLGKQRFLLLLHIINFISFALIFIGIFMQIIPFYAIFLFIFYLYCIYYLKKAKSEKTNIQTLSSIVVDGEQILWPILLVIGKFAVTLV